MLVPRSLQPDTKTITSIRIKAAYLLYLSIVALLKTGS